jgi:beta-1,4-mannosyltransferase
MDAHVLHDRPPRFFGPTPVDARHALFVRLKPQLDVWGIEAHFTQATGVRVASGDGSATPFTVTDPRRKRPVLRPMAERPVLVVSSTSWTEDEDFGLLLDALVRVDRQWAGERLDEAEAEVEAGAEVVEGPRRRSLRGKGKERGKGKGKGQGSNRLEEGEGEHPPPRPFVIVAVTGKGPLKAHYEARIRALRLRRVAVCTLWLEAADYPLLVGSADLGVCLHESTSGIDLPMKVLDMFGCGLPVCALRFSCLHELVRDQENGLVFGSGTELARALDALLAGFPQGETQLLDRLRAGVRGMARWEENWADHAAPVVCDEALGQRRWGGCWWWWVPMLALVGPLALRCRMDG